MVNLYNLEAEQALLGSILIDGSVYNSLKIEPANFYDERHQQVCEAIKNLAYRRENIDIITVAQELKRLSLSAVAETGYLTLLLSCVSSSMDAGHYAGIIKNMAVYRGITELAQRIIKIAESQPPESNDAIEQLSQAVIDFKRGNLQVDDLITPAMVVDELLNMVNDYAEPSHGISWGFTDLDRLTGGIYPELTIIGARPSVGKTELMINLVENLKGKRILFCSAEMSLRGLLERKAARKLKIDIVRLRQGNLTESQLKGIGELTEETANSQVYFLPPGQSSLDIYSRVEQLKETIGIDIVFIDYLQILKDCWISNRESMRIRVGQACKTLKGIVNDFNIPVVCASQLSRASEYRADKTPTLADLRESGDIEQDSDNVLLLYRDIEEEPNILEVKIAKGRQTGSFPHIKLTWLDRERRYADCYNG